MQSRREALMAGLALPFAGLAWPTAARAELPATPTCDGIPRPTLPQTAGPFFKPETPERRDFRDDGPGQAFTVMGFVVDRFCRPLPGAVIELWHANADGAYDLNGFQFRGHQRADERGRYLFKTIRPDGYRFRTPHFHVKILPATLRSLTTQLYFPDEPKNTVDFIHDEALEMRLSSDGAEEIGRFDFVVGA